MKGKKAASNPAGSAKEWQKTPFSNLIRYVPSGKYFARLRVAGKLIRKSLKTDVLSVAKLRLADLEKSEREAAESSEQAFNGRMTFGDCANIFKAQTEASTLLKASSKRYAYYVPEDLPRWRCYETVMTLAEALWKFEDSSCMVGNCGRS
jgi:hypothetical protein